MITVRSIVSNLAIFSLQSEKIHQTFIFIVKELPTEAVSFPRWFSSFLGELRFKQCRRWSEFVAAVCAVRRRIRGGVSHCDQVNRLN